VIRIASVSSSEAKTIILAHHYSGRCPTIMWAYGFIEDDELVGVLTFGMPASPFVSQSICGQRDKAIELNRIAFKRKIPNAVSQLIGFAVRDVPWDGYLVSYSDMAQGHSGTVYQAASWHYGGASKVRTDMDAGGNHPRHHLGDRSKRVTRSPKHRYWTASGKNKKKLIKASFWSSLEYPKDRTVWNEEASK